MGAGASTHSISISPSGKVVAIDSEGFQVILEGTDRREADIVEKAIALSSDDNCSEDIKIQVDELKRLACTLSLTTMDRRFDV